MRVPEEELEVQEEKREEHKGDDGKKTIRLNPVTSTLSCYRSVSVASECKDVPPL